MAKTGKPAFWLAMAALVFSGQARAITVSGKVFTYLGASGTAADSPSFAGLAVYRWGIQAQVGIENSSSNPLSLNALFPATATFPAYYFSDMDTLGQWTTPEAAGQTAVAVAETYSGQFTWAGPGYVSYSQHILTDADITGSNVSFSNQRQFAVPGLAVTGAGDSLISLSWTALPDSAAVISSYTIYRATYLPNGTYGTYEVLETVAAPPGGSVETDYNDAAVVTGTTYYYDLAVNFAWPDVAPASAGARPDQPFYTSFGQSLTVSALALNPTPTPSPSSTNTFSPTPTASATASSTGSATASATATHTSTSSPTNTPTVSSTSTSSATPTSTPASNTLTPSPVAPASTPLAWKGPEILAPVPARAGGMLCLYTAANVENARWSIYNISGELVSRLDDPTGRACWKIPSHLSGVFLARLEIGGPGGTRVRVFKIAVLP